MNQPAMGRHTWVVDPIAHKLPNGSPHLRTCRIWTSWVGWKFYGRVTWCTLEHPLKTQEVSLTQTSLPHLCLKFSHIQTFRISQTLCSLFLLGYLQSLSLFQALTFCVAVEDWKNRLEAIVSSRTTSHGSRSYDATGPSRTRWDGCLTCRLVNGEVWAQINR